MIADENKGLEELKRQTIDALIGQFDGPTGGGVSTSPSDWIDSAINQTFGLARGSQSKTHKISALQRAIILYYDHLSDWVRGKVDEYFEVMNDKDGKRIAPLRI